MPLQNEQRLLALLYTSASARVEYARQPQEFCKRFHLSPQACAAMAAIPNSSIENYARSLIAKRLNEVTKLLPMTAQSMGEAFREAFYAYSKEVPTRGVDRHLRDATAFAKFLAARKESAKAEVSVLRLEAARVSARGSSPLVVCMLPPTEWITKELKLRKPEWVVLAYLRVGRYRRWSRMVIPLPNTSHSTETSKSLAGD